MTRDEALRSAQKRFQEVGISSAGLDATLLLCHTCHIGKLDLVMTPEAPLTAEEKEAFEERVRRRCMHEPIAYILGKKEFWGMLFQVEKGVLIPRPDTETLVATAMLLLPEKEAPLRMADLGTGSGALAISLLKEFPHATMLATDINPIALACAQTNAQRLDVAERLTLLKGSWADPIDTVLDVIVSNPPYISYAEKDQLMADVRDYEPENALFAEEEGLAAYRSLIPQSYAKLRAGGLLLLEIGARQKDAVEALLPSQQWTEVRTFKDLSDHDRVVAAIKKEI